MKNKEIAEALYRISELLTLKNENVFKVRAYERASETISSLPEPIENSPSAKQLAEIPGIGESIADKIAEYISSGKIAYLDELKKSLPEGLFDIMHIQGMGPKKAKALFDKLGVTDIPSLKAAAMAGKIGALKGFGNKSEDNILKGIAQKDKFAGRILLSEAIEISDNVINLLSRQKHVIRISEAGSLRRRRETIGDIDILCSAQKGKEKIVSDLFTSLPFVSKINAHGGTKASIITDTGLQVDLRIVDDNAFGAALQYFTGSREHNIIIRGIAKDKGLLVNEYGVFKTDKTKKLLASKTEEDVYESLGLKYIPPELRENRGEIEAARQDRLPKLIELKDIKGDTHVHSKYSDGAGSIKDIADKAEVFGYEWLAVTDHSQSLKIAHGLTVERLKEKMGGIDKVNSEGRKVKLLCGSEVDILSDGSMDYPDEILKQLDFVIASIHTGFTQSETQITARIIKAIENPYVHAIGHLTGRLLNEREPYALDVDKILKAALKHKKFIELNAFPNRLDLNDVYCKKAKDMGVMICIGTDSHSAEQLVNMKNGISAARRGWLEKENVLNTLSFDKLKRALNTNI